MPTEKFNIYQMRRNSAARHFCMRLSLAMLKPTKNGWQEMPRRQSISLNRRWNYPKTRRKSIHNLQKPFIIMQNLLLCSEMMKQQSTTSEPRLRPTGITASKPMLTVTSTVLENLSSTFLNFCANKQNRKQRKPLKQ